MKRFILIGAAGYIAPRHMKAIKDTGNRLVAALDPNDSVGIIDSYFPDADFFTEFERFDRHIDKLKRQNLAVDYTSICSPNYLHDSHIRFGLRSNTDVICEKPLVLNPWNVEALEDIERETGKNVYNILQLRLHPSVIELKKKIELSDKSTKHDVDLTYITSRGHWYHISWKGNIEKSGGIATNIGVHFYDMLSWVFGDVQESKVFLNQLDKASGFLEFERARVRWYLSVDSNDLPKVAKEKGLRTHRSISVDKNEFEFSGGFTDLHTQSYSEILKGSGYKLSEAMNAIDIVYKIRNSEISKLSGNMHHEYLKGER
jgi:UDP-N-acetyl-2-amino-2-deoxyglucuronate dehydrogenase